MICQVLSEIMAFHFCCNYFQINLRFQIFLLAVVCSLHSNSEGSNVSEFSDISEVSDILWFHIHTRTIISDTSEISFTCMRFQIDRTYTKTCDMKKTLQHIQSLTTCARNISFLQNHVQNFFPSQGTQNTLFHLTVELVHVKCP